MWLTLLISFGIVGWTSGVLEGDHVCQEEERYMVNVTRSVLRKIKIRNYKWCMNVPPRCSYYTDEEQYVPETVEEEEIRMVNKCCPDFLEDDKGEKCIPHCANCIHGECEPNNKCNCHPGFWGDDCDRVCEHSRWGRNCDFNCSCERGDCDPVTGYCICPPGWKGNRCEEWLEDSQKSETTSTSSEISTSTRSGSLANLEQRMAKYAERTKYPTFQKYYTFYITTQKPSPMSTESKTKSKPDRFNDVGNWQPPRIYSITEKNAVPNTNLEETTINNHIESSINTEQRHDDLTTQPSAEVDTVPVPVVHDEDVQEFVNTKITDRVTVTQHSTTANPKAKVADGLEVSVSSTQTIFTQEEGWLNDESRLNPESDLSIHQNHHLNDSHLVFSLGAAVGVTATVVLILAAAILTSQGYHRRKKPTSVVAVAAKSKNDDDGGVPSVSIYTRSVFHTPLPDPPVFENPVFTTPMEYENNSNERGGTVETHVICSMHLPTNSTFKRDSRVVDAFYDHPPSTGSYRAASIPEPPEQNLEIATSELKEHLYDEIPCWKQPLPIAQSTNTSPNESLSYYANTLTNSNKRQTLK